MELSKIQIVALCVITTVLTDKFLINHQTNSNQSTPIVINQPKTDITPVATSSSALVTNNNSQDEIILRELANLRKDINSTLTDIKKTTTDTAVTSIATSSSLLKGMVKISSSQWKRIDVYEKPSTSSKIINSLVYDTIYFYRQKQSDWYQIDLDSGQIGWAQAQFLKEFP